MALELGDLCRHRLDERPPVLAELLSGGPRPGRVRDHDDLAPRIHVEQLAEDADPGEDDTSEAEALLADVEQAQADFDETREGITDATPVSEAGTAFASAAFAVEISLLRLYAAAGCVEDEATAIANGTDFGLVASCWTRDGARQMRMAKKLKAGQVFLNNYGAGGGVELPFGGRGLSGHGREKGFEALYGFTSLKTVAALHG